jgi:hypothetical protein
VRGVHLYEPRHRLQVRAPNGRDEVFAESGPGDGFVAPILFVGLLTLYIAVSRHQFVAYDANVMVASARNLVNHFTLRTTGAFDDYLHLSTPWSPYGVGVSVLAAPFYAISKAVGHESLILSLINPVITAVTGVCVIGIGRALGWSRWLSTVAATTFGVFTMALQSTTELFSEPAVGLCAAALVLALLRWRSGWELAPALAGCACAVAIQFRSDSILTICIALLALPWFVPFSEIFTRRNILLLMAPIGASVALLVWYNDVRFGRLLVTSYGSQTFGTPVFHGLNGLILSPGRGLFVYNPVALAGVIGLVRLGRRDSAVAILFVLLLIPRLLFFANWGSWQGGVTWGPRFLMPVVFLLVVSAVDSLQASKDREVFRTLRVALFAGLVIASAVVSFLSVRVPYEQWWQGVTSPTSRTVVAASVSNIRNVSANSVLETKTDFTWEASPIRGNWILLEKHIAVTAPELWRDGHDRVGWSLVSLSALMLGYSSVLAFQCDRTFGASADGDTRRGKRRGAYSPMESFAADEITPEAEPV